MERKQWKVLPEMTGERLDKYLADSLQVTRTIVQKWLQQDLVFVNWNIQNKNYRVQENDEIEVQIPDPIPCNVTAQEIPLDIVYEDDDLLVVNKPKGMVVHPAPGHLEGTLVNALLAHCGNSLSGIGGVTRPGIVHRIDKDTSGLLMVAKNDFAHQGLANQIKAHTFTREYETIVTGHLKESQGTVNQPIGRNPKDRKKMAVTTIHSRNAISHYRVLEELEGHDYVAVRLETGRTHQIRVHMAYLGHPVMGDPIYGTEKHVKELEGQCLHARKIGFLHPKSGEYMEFSSELPDYFLYQLQRLKIQ